MLTNPVHGGKIYCDWCGVGVVDAAILIESEGAFYCSPACEEGDKTWGERRDEKYHS